MAGVAGRVDCELFEVLIEVGCCRGDGGVADWVSDECAIAASDDGGGGKAFDTKG